MRIVFYILFSLAMGKSYGQNKISATVTNFENNKGVCRTCLYNSPASFNGNGKAVQCLQVNVSDKKAVLVFQNVGIGTYAVSVFHDANNNNQFDTNLLGIPKEGYGASKNNLPFAAAPSFTGNQFEVKENTSTSLSIKLRYLF